MAITTSTEPRYRYYEEAPERITVPVSELLDRIPAEFRQGGAGGDLSGRMIDLVCRDLFGGNIPRLPLGTLHDLLPELIQVPEGMDRVHRLSLPAGWLALHFRLITRREEIPQEPVAAELPFIASEAKSGEKSDANSDAASAEPSIMIFLGKEEDKQAKDSLGSTTVATPEEKGAGLVEVEGGAQSAPEGLTTVQVNAAGSPKTETVSPSVVEKKRGFFASLPIFRRHHLVKESTSAALTRELAPTPPDHRKLQLSESQTDKTLEHPNQPEGETSRGTQEASLTLERLWKLDPHDLIADPVSLQSLFMTEEKLSLDRVMAMAGQLPGLRACVLAHGDQVVCASSTPSGVDLRNLSSQAMTMLTQIRESSEKMGLGAVPAITLHADQGVLSFLHQGKLCLLVLHADRGFIPGVRERLQEMLCHLSAAKSLPNGPSSQPSLPI